MTSKIKTVIVLLATFLFGVWMTRSYYQQPKETIETDASVLIENVRDVCKLVTVEAELRELYDEKNNRNVTWYLPLPTNFTFSKTASIEVAGKVLVGYDLEKVEIIADSLNQTLIIKNLPQPEILSIEHDVKYRSLDESFFNAFTAKDFTRLHQNAKKILEQKAIEEHLLKRAETQGVEVLNVIEFMAKAVGWKVEFQHRLFEDVTPLPPDGERF